MTTLTHVQFSLSKDGIAVSATVPNSYFDSNVLPIITSLLQQIGSTTTSAPTFAAPAQPTGASGAAKLNLSVRAISEKLSSKTAGDVLTAAAASITLVQQRPEFSWKELITEAGKATGYWTKYHPGNAAKSLKTLRSKGVIVELASGSLALSPEAQKELAAVLAAGGK